MSFLVVDNKKPELDALTEILKNVRPDVSVFTASSAEETLEMSSLSFDAAFINPVLEEGKMNGIELAARLKAIHKDTHVIFVAGSNKYYREAFSVHADAYLLKKVSEDDIRKELDYLMYYYPSPLKVKGKVFVQTFGGFNVFLDGKIIKFPRKKAKELLAILVDRRGSPVTSREACAILFSHRPYDLNVNGYYHVLVNALTRTLGDAGIINIIERNKSDLAVNPDAFECDAYRYLKGDPSTAKQYRGDYMSCYNWTDLPEQKPEEKSRDNAQPC